MFERVTLRESLDDDVLQASDFLGSAADIVPPIGSDNGIQGVTGTDDLADLNLQTETVEIDPNADATAAYILPDGTYEARLLPIDKSSFGKDRASWGAGREKNSDGTPNPQGAIKWMWAALEYEVVEPGQPADKQHVFENYVSTMVNRTGTSRVATLLKALGVQVPARASHLDYIKLLLDVSQKSPAIRLETEWEARCGDCGKKMKGGKGQERYRPAKTGMRFFPELGGGKYDPVIECQYCGNQLTARPQVAHYHVSKRGTTAQATALGAAF